MKKFQGKNAWWFYLVIVVYHILPVFMMMKPEMKWDFLKITIFVIYYLFDFLLIPITVRNYVELYDDYFVFYYGFSKEKVFLNQIKSMKKSHSFMASSANSLDRIYIKTNQKELYISLKENDEFIKYINEVIAI